MRVIILPILLFFLVCLVSCDWQEVQNTIDWALGKEAVSNSFFTCGGYIDKNQDGYLSEDELIDVGKTTFRARGEVHFVGIFKKGTGTKIKHELCAPDGSIVYEKEHIQTIEPYTVIVISYPVRDLLTRKGAGTWKMKWYVEGILVNETKVNLIW